MPVTRVTPSAGAAAATASTNTCCGRASADMMTKTRVMSGSDLLEKFQPFAGDRRLVHADPGGIAAGPAETGDKTARHRIGDMREHDRNGAGLREQGRQLRPAGGDDNVRFQRDQFLGIPPDAPQPASRKEVQDRDVAALVPAHRPQAVDQGAGLQDAEQVFRGTGRGGEIADAAQPLGRLRRAGSGRQRGGRADESKKVAPPDQARLTTRRRDGR